jgi:hypothetical protein
MYPHRSPEGPCTRLIDFEYIDARRFWGSVSFPCPRRRASSPARHPATTRALIGSLHSSYWVGHLSGHRLGFISLATANYPGNPPTYVVAQPSSPFRSREGLVRPNFSLQAFPWLASSVAVFCCSSMLSGDGEGISQRASSALHRGLVG